MKPKPLTVLALGVALAMGHAAQAYDIKFTGKTLAGGKLMEDLLARITGYSKSRYQCSFIFAVNSAIQPPGYVPRTPAFRVTSPRHSYERWTVNLCGKSRVFFVAFGNNANGGADYKVQELLDGVMP